MKKIWYLVLLFIVTCQPELITPYLTAIPQIVWQKCIGGSSDDIAESIQQTSDGGYIVAGYTLSTDGDLLNKAKYKNYNAYILKLTSKGDTLWTRLLGGNGGDIAKSVLQTSEGYVIAAYSNSIDGDLLNQGNHGKSDFWIFGLNETGKINWQKCLGGSGDNVAFAIQKTINGYVVAGYTQNNPDGDLAGQKLLGGNDYWIVTINNYGNIVNQKCLGGYADEYPHSIQTINGGYVVAGYSYSTNGYMPSNHGYDDYFIAKLDNNLDTVWTQCLGGAGFDEAYSIQQTTDGGYIVAGHSNSANFTNGSRENQDFWIVKLNGEGKVIWQKVLGGSGNDAASSIQQTADGGYIITGYSNSMDGDLKDITKHGNYDCWIVKLDSKGKITWQKCFGGSSDDIGTSIQQTTDGSFIIAGYSKSTDGDLSGIPKHGDNDYWIIKLY